MKDAKGHGSNKSTESGSFTQGIQPMTPEQAHQLLGRPLPAAHQAAVQNATTPQAQPPFRMQSYTHEIVDPQGNVAARMKLGKSNGLAVDARDGISRSGGPSIHDAVSMPDYLANNHIDKGSFSADKISGALHFLTGKDFAGHTVRRVK